MASLNRSYASGRRHRQRGISRFSGACLVTPLALILCPWSGAGAQLDTVSTERPLRPLAFLEGSWAGRIDGTIGASNGQRRYRFVIGGRFLHMTHDRDPAESAPQDGDPEEWSIFSFDSQREMIVLREFLVEGLVNRYECEFDTQPTTLSCNGETREGGAGLILRLHYEVADWDHFTETFEILGSDGTPRVTMVGRWRRTGDGR